MKIINTVILRFISTICIPKKTFFIVLVSAVVAVGAIFALTSQKEKEMNPEEFLERFEKAAEEVLGEDIQQVSQTELVATLTYSHETEKDNNIYYRILKTTYGEAGDPSSIIGLNTDMCFSPLT